MRSGRNGTSPDSLIPPGEDLVLPDVAFLVPLHPHRCTFYLGAAAVQPALQSHSRLFIEVGGAKSPTHSAAPIKLPPPRLSPRSPSVAPPTPPRPGRPGLDERTCDRLNKHTGTQWSLCLQRPPASVSPSRARTHMASASAPSADVASSPPCSRMPRMTRTTSARVRCEVDVGALTLCSARRSPLTPRWAVASADAMAAVPRKRSAKPSALDASSSYSLQ